MRKAALIIFICFLTLAPLAVGAADGGWTGREGTLGKFVGGAELEKDIQTPIGSLISGVLALSGTIFGFLVVYAAILWMTASGNEEKVTKAKSILTAAVVGIFITFSAYIITYFVTTRLGGGEGGNTPKEGSSCGSMNGYCINKGSECSGWQVYSSDCVAPQVCCRPATDVAPSMDDKGYTY